MSEFWTGFDNSKPWYAAPDNFAGGGLAVGRLLGRLSGILRR